ncbi:arginine--tRNA ligase [Alloacidobacterium sp.]|uniref:arginine--tRNA ligase n=1 Tax=Alloacidobacterium sp. TaxID=2951999 RepID=UPI002D5E441B|nr:arginine--tRNA ligase [Alloacidobacterium sp.]HYK36196.1 arginine--tRNA ligase [Alloacidobacterium sp.]
MYLREQKKLLERLRIVLREKFQIELETIAIEQPPEIRFGEYALPVAFELARKLKKSPRKIAEEIVAGIAPLEGFAGFEVAGAGYINARLDRATAVHDVAAGSDVSVLESPVHSLVEHTSINPNKAAHVGHLRNAILGDTFVRLLRAAGQKVDVQNYIDNTGVQVADVVVGLTHLERKDLKNVQDLVHVFEQFRSNSPFPASLNALVEKYPLTFLDVQRHDGRIDYYCWDLYARVSQWYEADESQKQTRRQIRLDTLHAIEHGGNETAQIGELISTAVLRRHLETMLRFGIEYDLLPRESEILHLHFWNLAFEQLKAKGVLYFEMEGKNKGCWVMRRAGTAQAEEAEGPDEDAKVIVRSNGTVTYVGKDIAYHLWKFGLLGRDFAYNKFFDYPNHTCWISAEQGEPDHPHFGGAQAIYNVIDSRQSDPQANVIEALRGLGYTEQADHYTHFSYEMVALTPRCAEELGYEVAEEDRARPYIEVSGRKGFGVKADDLIDKLVAATQKEVDSRHPELSADERGRIAKEIAVGALRYFMLKYTRNTIIAFDFNEALSFEGETGPYMQYAVVRTRSIFRKAGVTAGQALADFSDVDASSYLTGEDGDGIWQVWLRAAKTTLLLDQCIATAEPAYLAKHAFQLAQEFSNFYRKHHILTEADPKRKKFLLATAAITQRELIRSLAWLGINAPEVM